MFKIKKECIKTYINCDDKHCLKFLFTSCCKSISVCIILKALKFFFGWIKCS